MVVDELWIQVQGEAKLEEGEENFNFTWHHDMTNTKSKKKIFWKNKSRRNRLLHETKYCEKAENREVN